MGWSGYASSDLIWLRYFCITLTSAMNQIGDLVHAKAAKLLGMGPE